MVVVALNKVTSVFYWCDEALFPTQLGNSRSADQHLQTMSKLPFELCKPIVDELDSRSDFIAFAPTTKAFWSEVISKLYDAVTLGDETTTTLFLSTYRANPTLVQLYSSRSYSTNNLVAVFRYTIE